jgi:hypothetical protein
VDAEAPSQLSDKWAHSAPHWACMHMTSFPAVQVRIPVDRRGRPKGIALVVMDGPESKVHLSNHALDLGSRNCCQTVVVQIILKPAMEQKPSNLHPFYFTTNPG